MDTSCLNVLNYLMVLSLFERSISEYQESIELDKDIGCLWVPAFELLTLVVEFRFIVYRKILCMHGIAHKKALLKCWLCFGSSLAFYFSTGNSR